MRKVLAIFVGSASALLIATSVVAQTGSNHGSMSNSNGYPESSQYSGRSHSQSSSYQKSGSSNDASTALSHLYQARDELNAMSSSPRRDQALHDIDAAIDQARAISPTSGHATH